MNDKCTIGMVMHGTGISHATVVDGYNVQCGLVNPNEKEHCLHGFLRIDTGAMCTHIFKSSLEQLKLRTNGRTQRIASHQGIGEGSGYNVSIYIPYQKVNMPKKLKQFENHLCWAINDIEDEDGERPFADILGVAGMDIINTGRFYFDGPGQQFAYEFDDDA